MKIRSFLDAGPGDIRPMTYDESETFLKAVMIELHYGEELDSENAAKLGPIGQIFESRLRGTGVKVSFWTALFVISLGKGSPGMAVMWAYAIKRLYEKTGECVDIRAFAEAFPVGVPTEEFADLLWDEQKREGAPLGNGLDDRKNWE